MIVRTTATSCCSSVTKSFFVHLTILSYRLTQEWILTRTNVRQTTIVQLDIVVRTYEHTTAIAFSLIFEVLQIDIVTLFVTTADFDIREFGNILYLSQEKQTSLHLFSVKRISHINITFPRTEYRVTVIIVVV